MPEPQIDITTPHPARMYDYYLGGKDNYEPDRVAAERMIETTNGGVRAGARQNRAFLVRMVRALTESGITQFLDVGTGIPTSPNTHEIAQAIAPEARVAYVDNDPIVFVHAQALLTGNPAGGTFALRADLRDPDSILGHSGVRELIDFSRPVAVLFIAVLQFLEESEDPYTAVAEFMRAMPPGSVLALSHVTPDFDPETALRGAKAYDRATAKLTMRTRAQIERFFEGLEFLEPGLVQVSRWRPDGPVPQIPGNHPWVWAGVARKP